MLLDKAYTRAIDFWHLGVMIYQMTTLHNPFLGEDEDEIYDAILNDDLPVYPHNMPSDAKDLIRRSLVRKPEGRIGYHNGVEEIMAHEYFKGVDWDALYRKEVEVPFIPEVKEKKGLCESSEEEQTPWPGFSDEPSGKCRLPSLPLPLLIFEDDLRLTSDVPDLTPAMQAQFASFSSYSHGFSTTEDADPPSASTTGNRLNKYWLSSRNLNFDVLSRQVTFMLGPDATAERAQHEVSLPTPDNLLSSHRLTILRAKRDTPSPPSGPSPR